MRGGLERWKRGADSRGVRHAISYALKGTCDAHLPHPAGADSLENYSDVGDSSVTRYIVENGAIASDELSAGGLRVWLTGHDPITGEERGTSLLRPDADLLLDGTLNHPKSYSIAALLHPELAAEFEALQDRIRDRAIVLWQQELNARRGHGGLIRESIARLEVVELQHRRSRALDPHAHRHLWLNVKVRGEDGRWTNVDSRVAMKFHTIINAEGELAACTDPQWIAALGRHGYTIGADGEIAELAAAVTPLSRRSAQIEANRAQMMEQWATAHGGSSPSVEVLQQIDRRAWAVARPNKPAVIDELSWEATVLDELATIDSELLEQRPATSIDLVSVESLDLDTLATAAVADADARSTGSSGRFSRYDLRAGAVRALSKSGVVAERDTLEATVREIIGRANRLIVRLSSEPAIPDHVKSLMATETMRLKVRVAGLLDALATPGRSRLPHELGGGAASQALIDSLDPSQTAAACAIAGTVGLVTVVGPAGAGKTTMLRAALTALTSQRRRMLVVAPTRKAATVASRETGAESSSVHALLYDHGFRWSTEQSGAQLWRRLAIGEFDHETGVSFVGAQRYALHPGDRIVVDEAGVLDLHAANALFALAVESGAGVAMVGDPHQALPVGHAGAMASAIRHSPASIELDTVHRFHDPVYALLTLKLRNPRDHEHARSIAEELLAGGHAQRVDSVESARIAMIDEYFAARVRGRRVALVCGANSEVDIINVQIQQRRVEIGELDPTRVALGMGEQRLLIGDAVQTRRNDRQAGVDNRAQWIVRGISADSVTLVAPSDSGELRRVSREYALEHVQLAYASTVHGVQGETVDSAVVGPDVDAAGLYVGLTRGRDDNLAIVVARTDAAALAGLAATMLRGTTEVTINDSMRAAEAELRRAARDATLRPQGFGQGSADARGASRLAF